jgi:hypothetical protein
VLPAKRLGAERIILMGRHKDRTDLGQRRPPPQQTLKLELRVLTTSSRGPRRRTPAP